MTMLMPMVRIKFKCASVDSFIEKYHPDVDPTGIFVRTRSPVPTGTAISFDLRLGENQPLFSGSGVVAWARQDDRLAPLLEPGMMLSFERLTPDSYHTFDYVLGQKRALDEALESVPTLVRTFADEHGASSRPLPMTAKMSAEEMESLRARMREDIVAEASAPELPPPPQPEPQPQAASASLAKVLVLRASDAGADLQPLQAAGVIEARPRTPMEITASTVAPLTKQWVRLVGISIVSWMLVLVLFAVIRWELVGRMLQWIHAA